MINFFYIIEINDLMFNVYNILCTNYALINTIKKILKILLI